MLKQITITLLITLSPPIMAMSSSLDGVGPLNGIEWQVDIPWRMEPTFVSGINTSSSKQPKRSYNRVTPRISRISTKNKVNSVTIKNGLIASQQFNFIKSAPIAMAPDYELYPGDDFYKSTQYDPIPITFTMHDVAQQEGLQENGQRILLNRFCGMYVIEFQPGKVQPETQVTFIPPNEFYEIEASKGWGITGVYIDGSHQIKKIWQGESPNGLLNMGQWKEWHGTAYYTPVSGAPKGKDLRIIAAARVSMSNNCSDQYFSATDIVNKLRRNHQFHPAFEAVNAIINELNKLKETQNKYTYQLLKSHIKKLEDLDIGDFTALDTLYFIRSQRFGSNGFTSQYQYLEPAYNLLVKRNNPNDLGNLIFVNPDKLNQEDSLFFGDFLRTHYAAAPLPDFGNEWAYGDLHYHSQGTDNEGESGTSFRSALAAMKASGLDYAFATDHASDSEQITGIKSYEVKYDSPWYIPDFIVDWALDKVNGVFGGIPTPQHEALRDMSPERFDHLLHWLQGENGGNEEVSSRPGSNRTPQIFLGGEVDVIPEASVTDAEYGSYRYGDGLFYSWLTSSCYGLPEAIIDYSVFPERCVEDGLQVDYENGRVMLKDVQGLLETDYFARQHFLYLPYNVDPSLNNEDTFISSESTAYGGANRNLDRILDDLDNPNNNTQGVVFLAHPVSAAKGKDIGRLGPDIYPYSEAQLEVAFASPSVLGLQLWNENAKLHSSDSRENSNFPFLHGTRLIADNGIIDWGQLDWRWEKRVSQRISLHHGAAMWDMVNLWGITPERTQAIGLDNNTPRKFFMAGGSDAHGDMNYRREGQMEGWKSANDTALGSPRNLTFIGSEHENNNSENPVITQDQVIDGLRSGRFSVTDGPAFRIAIDTNNNGEIDEQDILMGEDATLAETHGATTQRTRFINAIQPLISSKINVIVEWKSTVEWGPVKEIDLMVGVQSDSHPGLVYKYGKFCGSKILKDSQGRQYCPAFSDIYRWDTSGNLRFNVPASNGFGGKYTFQIDAFDYRLFDKACQERTQTSLYMINHGIGHSIDDFNNIIPNPLPLPPVDCLADNVKNPERMFIRAVASTIDNTNPPVAEDIDEPVKRYAYSNPVWVRDLSTASQYPVMKFQKSYWNIQ